MPWTPITADLLTPEEVDAADALARNLDEYGAACATVLARDVVGVVLNAVTVFDVEGWGCRVTVAYRLTGDEDDDDTASVVVAVHQ
jgi:hypothetical protein